VGQALGHSFGDPTGFCYVLLWGFGGKAADEHGKVAIDSKETRAAVAFMKQFWADACDESGLAWDDSSNNRAFAAGAISATRNGASIYFAAKKDLREKKSELANVTDHFVDPRGVGQVRVTSSQYNRIVFKYSKVQTAAKNWIKFCLQKENYSKLMEVNGGYTNGITPERNNHPVWDSDPKLKAFKHLPEVTVPQGWPAPFDRRAAEAEAKYIVVDMFARAVKGESIDSAIKFAENELELIYA
jgi:multiple sugar transport system substrate-binding protein